MIQKNIILRSMETNRQITNNEAAISKQERKLQELRKNSKN